MIDSHLLSRAVCVYSLLSRRCGLRAVRVLISGAKRSVEIIVGINPLLMRHFATVKQVQVISEGLWKYV